ncbi:MAG: hypothetical protein E5W93_04670 [Mesorhizobium sp.]|nr:MAG: hypothetical protein E5W93_04670 [Mesorhizobium sp.]
MKFMNYIAAIVVAAILGGASGAWADKVPKQDLSCSAVNRAYIQINRPLNYSYTTYLLKSDGSLKLFKDFRVVGGYYYTRYSFSDKWLAHGQAYFPIMDRMGPRFTSCKLVGTEGTLSHYSATWHDFPYTAAAELWIDAVSFRLMKVLRRYPEKLWEFPFATAIELYQYDDVLQPRPDPSCIDVNNAYEGGIGR